MGLPPVLLVDHYDRSTIPLLYTCLQVVVYFFSTKLHTYLKKYHCNLVKENPQKPTKNYILNSTNFNFFNIFYTFYLTYIHNYPEIIFTSITIHKFFYKINLYIIY